jgi:very-short-patch-repair endonuclease
MTVVSSFGHHDIDLNRSGGRGVQLLKAYLEYAASGGSRLPEPEHAGDIDSNAFEADIRDALEARGIRTRPQFGASRYRIDLVAMHPERPGRPVLAIECDGATYHSSSTARDRDRLRQAHLHSLGWRFHRIWSTDWFFSREEEVERALAAFRDAVLRADREDAEGVRPPRAVRSQAQLSSMSPLGPLPNRKRGEPPALPVRDSIELYTELELRTLAEWVSSDGLLRTEEEMVREMLGALPFRRLGGRIRARLQNVLRSVHHTG